MSEKEGKLDQLTNDVRKILFHLESDDSIKHKGIGERLSNVEKGLKCLQDEELIKKGKNIVYGAIGGVSMYFIVPAIKWVATKIF